MMAEELPKCVLGHPYNKENSEQTVLVHLLVEIIQQCKMFAHVIYTKLKTARSICMLKRE
jgi:hypothetical protein